MLSPSSVAALVIAAVSAAPIGDNAVWKPPADFHAKVTKACGGAKDFGSCFVEKMRTAGASPAAVEFAKRTGNQGYLTGFRDTGLVDVAFVEYPFRANENALMFLVNGEPPMIDVDDVSRIDKTNLQGNADYARLLERYPDLAIFPSDRRGRAPAAAQAKTGGQRFIVLYELHDGCHACAVVGDARISFDFDVEGRFVGTRVVRVRIRGNF
jgi:hypothetical protein